MVPNGQSREDKDDAAFALHASARQAGLVRKEGCRAEVAKQPSHPDAMPFGGKLTGICVDNQRRGKSVGSMFAPQSCAPVRKARRPRAFRRR
jgi:hypothetical protein